MIETQIRCSSQQPVVKRTIELRLGRRGMKRRRRRRSRGPRAAEVVICAPRIPQSYPWHHEAILENGASYARWDVKRDRNLDTSIDLNAYPIWLSCVSSWTKKSANATRIGLPVAPRPLEALCAIYCPQPQQEGSFAKGIRKGNYSSLEGGMPT